MMGSADSLYNSEAWYAMRATYRRECKVQKLLSEAGIKSFIPMRTEERIVMGRRRKYETPAVHNLIFVRATRTAIQGFKEHVPYLQYMMGRNGMERPVPIIVPDREMDDFMRVVNICGEKVEYLPVGERTFRAGMRVRVHGGPLDGVEGELVRKGKSRDRKLVVKLSGVMSVTTVTVGADRLEII